MARYKPLRDYLHGQTFAELTLSFAEIERLVGALPASAQRPQWWANARRLGSTQREAWRAAGYDAFLISGANKVRFVRVGPSTGAYQRAPTTPTALRMPQTAVPPPPPKPALTAQALLAGGFELTSRWVLTPAGALISERPPPSHPGVYAFVSEGLAVYVGIATVSIRKRLYFYTRPGCGFRRCRPPIPR
ncbi:MAG: hypothetical protein JO127_17040 [Caulobacteraceae bacterium]|nr:hypothetical protein [Caulobacteraceae bacterium]